MKLPSSPPLIGGLALLAWLVPGPGSAAQAQPARAPGTLTATLRSVDADARQVDVLTGVGHALRVVTVRVEPECVIRVDGAPAPLGALTPGRIVRIAYRQATAGDVSGAAAARVARTIETLPKPAPGAGR
ncbi:MAG TPA: hypothetical protein VLL75_08620 [Vicinamibacteria bacterium]|nr:hypothetical protein [Vicinamibacteria bacterium]